MKPTIIALLAFSLCLHWVGADKKPLTKEESAKVIEAKIRKAAKKSTGELTKADLEKIERLDLTFNKLTDLKGLEKLTKLEKLDLFSNQLTDVTALEKLNQLKELGLGHNQLTELPKGLEMLTQLKTLGFGVNKLTDVKGLEKLTELEELALYNNPDLTKAQIAELQKALPK